MRLAGHVARIWDLVNVCMVLVRKYVGKETHGGSGKSVFFLQIFRNLSLLTLPISALCYCTVFSVLLWLWQSVCSSYCRQLNAVSFSTIFHAALYRSIYSLLTWSYLGTLKGFFAALQNSGERILALSCLTVRPPSAWNNSAPTGWIFMKIGISIKILLLKSN